MKIDINTDDLSYKLKNFVSDLFYCFGMKVHFSNPPVKFLENTLNTELQFNHLLKYYEALQKRQYYYQKPQWNGRYKNKRLGTPTIELVKVNDIGLKHYAMIWTSPEPDRSVKVIYRQDGVLCWSSEYNIDSKNKPSAIGGGFIDINLIWDLYQ